ncbi:MAG: uroporphyrinogen decarboxylase [Treponema sp.]|nr:uroporphyrinogen decarboxylase [Treponema sp.]
MDKREWVLGALRNEKPDRVPAGFWFHFTADEVLDGFEHPEMFEQNLRGHVKFYQEFQPDFIKIMSDGFFIYPNRELQRAEKAADLWKVSSIGPHHPWIEKQVELVKTLTAIFGKDVLSFYNIFSPATGFKFSRRDSKRPGEALLGDFIREDEAALIHALRIAAADLAVLARRVIEEGGADGIYYSAQDQHDSRIDTEVQNRVFAPVDAEVLEAANKAGALSILHICGYAGHRNILSHYTRYPAGIINWASAIEGVSLGEGKKLFGGKPVIGGFANTTEGILYRGGEAEIKAETRRLLGESGRAGVILGADCTVPRDIDLRHLQWVREAAVEG